MFAEAEVVGFLLSKAQYCPAIFADQHSYVMPPLARHEIMTREKE
jgi:hypothetical protein